MHELFVNLLSIIIAFKFETSLKNNDYSRFYKRDELKGLNYYKYK